MRRLPPVLTIALAAMWLLLNESASPGQIVLAVALAVALGWASTNLRPLRPRLRRPWVAVQLAVIVLADIVRSNVHVAAIVLGLVRARRVRSGFVHIPLELRDPHALAVLAAIVTSTPGTVWADLAPDGSRLTLHVLDLRDENAWIQWIKHRYERPLMRIFE
ncbi:MAG TPA: Na+/H+ antiporter subunit E [Gammaproteobacteria bacterium]